MALDHKRRQCIESDLSIQALERNITRKSKRRANRARRIRITIENVKSSTGEEEVFVCPVNWTIDQAESRIRKHYNLTGGGIDDGDNISMLGSQFIESAKAPVSFVKGKPILKDETISKEELFVFSMLPRYVGQKPSNHSHIFDHIPNRQELLAVSMSLFNLESVCPSFELKGRYFGADFSITDKTVLVPGVQIELWSRYYTTQLLIGTWVIRQSSKDVQRLLILSHPNKDDLGKFITEVLEPHIKLLGGQVEEESDFSMFKYGSIETPIVKTHNSTARRIDSCDDIDTISRATYFDIPSLKRPCSYISK